MKIKSAHNESCYKRYRNKLNHLLKIAEKTHVAEKLESNKSNLKKTWSILKGIINKRKSAKIQEKFKLSDGSITSDKQMISERFNDFFVNIDNSLSRGIPVVNTSPTEYMGERLLCSIFLEPVVPQELDEIIKSLKNGAPGSDGITAQILKTIRQGINGPVCYLCNRSLTEARGYSRMNWDLRMCFHFLNQAILYYSTTSDLYPCCVYYRKSLKRLCTPDCIIFWNNKKSWLKINSVSENTILRTWH